MANILKIKSGEGTPSSVSLSDSELGYSRDTGILYIGKKNTNPQPLNYKVAIGRIIISHSGWKKDPNQGCYINEAQVDLQANVPNGQNTVFYNYSPPANQTTFTHFLNYGIRLDFRASRASAGDPFLIKVYADTMVPMDLRHGGLFFI